MASRRHHGNEGIAVSDSARRHRHCPDVLKNRSIAWIDERGVEFVESVPEEVVSSLHTLGPPYLSLHPFSARGPEY